MVQAEERVDRRIVFRTHLPLGPTHLLVGGLFLIPGFILQESLVLRYAQIAGYMLLAAACGRRVLVAPNLVMIAGIVVANLFSPLGRVLFAIGPFAITSGALEDGLYKASVLIGLIYISRLAVRDDLVLPGRFGALIATTFRYFGLITQHRGVVTFKEDSPKKGRRRSIREAGDFLIERVDLLLRRLEGGEPAREGAAPGREGAAPQALVRSSAIGLAAMGALILVNSGLALLGRLVP